VKREGRGSKVVLLGVSDDIPMELYVTFQGLARSAYVMSVVTPAERPAAASFTAVPRSLASAAGPSLAGAMFAAGLMAAPLVSCGVLKIAYDVALFTAFRKVAPRI
jgi:hypothetical protein